MRSRGQKATDGSLRDHATAPHPAASALDASTPMPMAAWTPLSERSSTSHARHTQCDRAPSLERDPAATAHPEPEALGGLCQVRVARGDLDQRAAPNAHAPQPEHERAPAPAEAVPARAAGAAGRNRALGDDVELEQGEPHARLAGQPEAVVDRGDGLRTA